MKILVVGGSYFLGRVFTMLASKEHELTLINRGNISMKRYGVKEYQLDRRDVQKLRELPCEHYDVIVDFCAYNPGDIKLLTENLPGFPGLVQKYIFISTVDVYERNVGYVKDEETPLSKQRYSGEVGDYIYGKICLEKELKEVCDTRGVNYAIIRPSIIYGPNNYAPRESEYIKMISRGLEIKYPKDAEGRFQLVYVKDVVDAIIKACKRTKSREYNICPNEPIGYEDFVNVLKKVSDLPVKLNPITIEEALKEGIHMPFPALKEETELYDGEKAIMELGITYTSLEDGMRKTYNAFKTT